MENSAKKEAEDLKEGQRNRLSQVCLISTYLEFQKIQQSK